jgi:hypothetical protein
MDRLFVFLCLVSLGVSVVFHFPFRRRLLLSMPWLLHEHLILSTFVSFKTGVLVLVLSFQASRQQVYFTVHYRISLLYFPASSQGIHDPRLLCMSIILDHLEIS